MSYFDDDDDDDEIKQPHVYPRASASSRSGSGNGNKSTLRNQLAHMVKLARKNDSADRTQAILDVWEKHWVDLRPCEQHNQLVEFEQLYPLDSYNSACACCAEKVETDLFASALTRVPDDTPDVLYKKWRACFKQVVALMPLTDADALMAAEVAYNKDPKHNPAPMPAVPSAPSGCSAWPRPTRCARSSSASTRARRRRARTFRCTRSSSAR
jgi:hypothetical protein